MTATQPVCWSCGRAVDGEAAFCQCVTYGSPTPLRFDRYRVDQELGHGSYGVVYKCKDEVMGRDVAVKKLDRRASRALDEVREVQVAGRINHPNIVTIHDILDAHTAIVMELLGGGSLGNRIRSDPNWAKHNALALMLDVAEGLQAAHSAGVLHLDIKPDNILLTEDGHAKIGDFGVCKLIESSEYVDGLAGTFPYMAFEVLEGAKYKYEADVHSLGCVMYELFAQRVPWSANGGTMAWFAAKTNQVPVPLREIDPGVSDLTSQLVSRMLARGPDRIRNTGTVLQHLLTLTSQGKAAVPRTIDDLQVFLGAIYGFVNADRTPLYFLNQYLISVRSASNALRLGAESSDLDRLLPRAFAWLCAATNSVNLTLGQAIWLKYADSCPYCDSEVCQCPGSWSRNDSDRNQILLAKMLDRHVNQAPVPKTFAEYQAQFDRMFGELNRAEGVESTVNHVYSEVAEAMDAVIHLLPHERDSSGSTLLAMQLEFSDLIAWFFALVSIAGPDFDFVGSLLGLFANGCYACGHERCICPEPLGIVEWRKALHVVPEYELNADG